MSARRRPPPGRRADVDYDPMEECPLESNADDQIIEIEDFIDAQPGDDRYFCHLNTDVRDIERSGKYAYPSNTDDSMRASEFLYHEEQKYFERFRLPKDLRTTINNHEEANKVVLEMSRETKSFSAASTQKKICRPSKPPLRLK